MEMNINSAVTTEMKSNVPNYSVSSGHIDAATGAKETEWINSKANQYLGYYKKIPDLKKAIDALATWVVGKGYETEDADTEVTLKHINGWGEDTFNSIAWNLFVQKKVYGDAFAEIIRDEKTGMLLNLKPLNPANIKIIADEKGIIKRYEQMNKLNNQVVQKFNPEEMLHLCNDRIADEIHGVSIIEAVEWIILAKNEAMDDFKICLHRNVFPVRILEVDTDDATKIEEVRKKYETAIKNKEIIIVPKGTATFTSDGSVGNAFINPMPFINYLDNAFYRAVGVPKIITGGSEEFTEASSKIAYLTFEQVYVREQTEFIADLWNQIFIKIKLNRPVSLQNELLTDERKDGTNALMGGGFQPNDIQAGRGA